MQTILILIGMLVIFILAIAVHFCIEYLWTLPDKEDFWLRMREMLPKLRRDI